MANEEVVVVAVMVMAVMVSVAAAACVLLNDTVRNKLKELLGMGKPEDTSSDDSEPDAPPTYSGTDSAPTTTSTADCVAAGTCPNTTGWAWVCTSPWANGYQYRKYGPNKDSKAQCCKNQTDTYGSSNCKDALRMTTKDDGTVARIRKELDEPKFVGKIRGELFLGRCRKAVRNASGQLDPRARFKNMITFKYQRQPSDQKLTQACVSGYTGYISCFDGETRVPCTA